MEMIRYMCLAGDYFECSNVSTVLFVLSLLVFVGL